MSTAGTGVYRRNWCLQQELVSTADCHWNLSSVRSVYSMLSIPVYRVSQEECARPRESVPYVKVYRYNPKHLYPKLNGYGDNGLRKVGAS